MDLKRIVQAAARYGRERWAPDVDPNAHPLRRAGQVGTVISVVVIAVAALVGVLVLARVNSALPSDALYQDGKAQDDANRTALGNSSQAIVDGFSGALDLIPVVLLVLVATLVIGIVQRLRS